MLKVMKRNDHVGIHVFFFGNRPLTHCVDDIAFLDTEEPAAEQLQLTKWTPVVADSIVEGHAVSAAMLDDYHCL